MKGERGATLLETLIALAITGLLSAAVVQMTGFGLRVVERGEAATAAASAAFGDERRLRDALTGMEGAGFSGDAAGLIWRGPGPDGAGGLWRLDQDGRVAACPGRRCEAAADWLTEPVAAFAFAEEDSAWAEEWEEGPPPALIRLTLAGGDVIVAPRVRGAR